MVRPQLGQLLPGYLMMAPGFLLIFGLIAYPFGMSIYLSLTDANIATLHEPSFVGLRHYIQLLSDEVFLRAALNSLVFTMSAVVLKLLLGLGMAHLLFEHFAGRRVVISLLLFAWVAPIALTLLSWLWLLDSMYGPLNWLLVRSGLMSYGPDFEDVFRRAGRYAGRVLKGANPAELAMEEPREFRMVLNMKTARELGIAVPPAVRLRADEVIE